MKKFTVLTLLPYLLATGCAVFHSDDPRPVARDLVCLYNRDLTCVRVRIDEDAPNAVYEEATYYFCDDDCRVVFLSDPEKYLAAGDD